MSVGDKASDRTASPSPDAADAVTLTPEELEQRVQAHAKWLSDPKNGARLDLSGLDLSGKDERRTNLAGEDLTKAVFRAAKWLSDPKTDATLSLSGEDERGANLAGKNLTEAIFRGTNLSNANLTNANLTGANLDAADLTDAGLLSCNLTETSLKEAILNRSNLEGANLRKANLQGAELRRVNFKGAELRGAILRDADLQYANLEEANDLLSSQLAGANVAGAKLPKAIAEFGALKNIAEATSNAQKLFIAMLGGCLYSWLTIGTTTDAALLTNSASSPLPIIQTALPIVGFYVVAPLVLFTLYCYFHLNLQRLWESLADLPAVFPDGRTLDRQADPWLLNGLVCAHFTRLRHTRPPLSRWQTALSILCAWWIVPFTLLMFWERYLTRHDLMKGTSLHVLLLALSVGFAVMSQRLMRGTLRGRLLKSSFLRRLSALATIGLVGLIFGLASFGAINGVPPERYFGLSRSFLGFPDAPQLTMSNLRLRRLVPDLLSGIGLSPFANLREEVLSTQPKDWTGATNTVSPRQRCAFEARRFALRRCGIRILGEWGFERG